jgi:hypothetical protein
MFVAKKYNKCRGQFYGCSMHSCYRNKCKKCTKESYTYATKELQLRNQTNTKLPTPPPPANEWKLLDLGVWWKYRLAGHVWVHGSKRFSLSQHCLAMSTYSTSVVDWATLDCLIKDTDTKEEPKNYQVPEVDFLYNRHPAKSTCQNPWRTK